MLPQADGTPRGTAPVSGQHSAEILREHGYDEEGIERLLADGIVAEATSA
jgi:crotonobetainyl-CoA:carnitine CoA-transferase CaiB-like acyl-CoA transferase